MDELTRKLFSAIKSSNRILITSHLNPDPDAVGSSLFTLKILKENFPDKAISLNIEGEFSEKFSFLEGFDQIENQNLFTKFNEYNPDLFIMLDGNRIYRFSLNDADAIKELISQKSIKSVVIDHHEEEGRDEVDIFINNKKSSTSEDVYTIFVEKMKLDTYTGYGNPVMFGILGDTGRFLYDNPNHRDTFRIVSDLVDSGVSIEALESAFTQFQKIHLDVIGELLKNLVVRDQYVYSFISDQFTDEVIVKNKIKHSVVSEGYNHFLASYIRNVDGRKWGFIVTRQLRVAQSGVYNGSFRAQKEAGINVSKFAALLNGGGIKLAAGFQRIETTTVEDAIKIVEKIISDNYEDATSGD